MYIVILQITIAVNEKLLKQKKHRFYSHGVTVTRFYLIEYGSNIFEARNGSKKSMPLSSIKQRLRYIAVVQW